ncbi:MAG: nucleotide exchange factor GrpE [Planctomycetes bacterium]|nr:nucleotide exchange factor GrpE [Planctomycetota bacterium]
MTAAGLERETDRDPPRVPPEAREEIEAILSAFRQWLLDAEEWRSMLLASDQAPEPGEAAVDLHTLVGEWVALKQEFRLASRGNKTSREQLDQAVEAFHTGLDHMGEEARKLLESLVRERDRLRDELQARLESQEAEWVERLLDTRELIARGVQASQQAHRRLGWRRWLLPRAILGGLLEGHDLALRRIDATLESHGIRPIECDGQPVDPERMRVVDVVRRDDRPPGQVAEVLRRGYMRENRVIRYAEVLATRASDPPGASAQEAPEPGASLEPQEE